jgi:hypothetical protein
MNTMVTAQRPPLKRIGAAWKGKPESKALLTGTITIDGKRQRWLLFKNDKKQGSSSSEPDYVILSGTEPEVDEYAHSGSQKRTPPPDDLESEIAF